MGTLAHTTADLVFVPQIDADHQTLFAWLEKVREGAASGDPATSPGLALWHLSKSLSAHFAGEERLMRRSEYDGFEWHQRQHQTGRKRMATLVEAVQSKNEQREQEALQQFEDWLKDHVALADRMFAAHLRNDLRTRAVS